MNRYVVKLPITGIAYVAVEAESEEAAIEKALEVVTVDNIEEWEAVEAITQGNVCYALHPWEAEAEDRGPVDDPTPDQ